MGEKQILGQASAVMKVMKVSDCFRIHWWECWSGSGDGEFEASETIGGVPLNLSDSELWKDWYELAILNEWFPWASEEFNIIYWSLCGLKGLLAICDRVVEEKWEVSELEMEVSESRLISCGVSIMLETVWIGCGNLELQVLFVLANLISWLENCSVFE